MMHRVPRPLGGMLAARRLASKPAAPAPGIICPGSGIFFWWQAGATGALASKFELGRSQFAGTSGGALAATLAACGCRTDDALGVAASLCRDAGVFDRGPWALRGVWGSIVRAWLGRLLPTDAAERCRGRVAIVVRRPLRGPSLVHDFRSRDDLIDACLASVHVPLYMDGRFTATFRGAAHIDDDFLSLRRGTSPLALPLAGAPSIRLACGKDPRIRN